MGLYDKQTQIPHLTGVARLGQESLQIETGTHYFNCFRFPANSPHGYSLTATKVRNLSPDKHWTDNSQPFITFSDQKIFTVWLLGATESFTQFLIAITKNLNTIYSY